MFHQYRNSIENNWPIGNRRAPTFSTNIEISLKTLGPIGNRWAPKLFLRKFRCIFEMLSVCRGYITTLCTYIAHEDLLPFLCSLSNTHLLVLTEHPYSKTPSSKRPSSARPLARGFHRPTDELLSDYNSSMYAHSPSGSPSLSLFPFKHPSSPHKHPSTVVLTNIHLVFANIHLQ